MLKRSIDINHYEHFKVLTVLKWFASEYSSRSCSKMCTMWVVLESLLSVSVIAIYFDYLSNHSIFKSPGVGRGGDIGFVTEGCSIHLNRYNSSKGMYGGCHDNIYLISLKAL